MARERKESGGVEEERRKEKLARWDENMKIVGPVGGIPILCVGSVCGLLFLLWLVVNGFKFMFA